MVLCLAGLGVYLLARQSTQSPLGTASRLPRLYSPGAGLQSSDSLSPDFPVPKSLTPTPSAPGFLQPGPDVAPTHGAPETEPHIRILSDCSDWVKTTPPTPPRR